MRTHTANPTNDAAATQSARLPAGAGGVTGAHMLAACPPAFEDNTVASLALQRHQQRANDSPGALQLKQHAQMMSAASTASMHGRAQPAQRHVQQPRVGDEELAQGEFEQMPVQREAKSNNTGLPDQLKSGIEALSGMSMDQVRVHYNSERPAQLQAHAYAQGSEIHVGPGQEQHLPHEAWHVVQQAQGRVAPTLQMKGAGTVQLAIGDRPFADGYASILSDPQWMPHAEQYEQRLGNYAYQDARSMGAVSLALGKMQAVVLDFYQDELNNSDDQQTLMREVFTKDDPGSAGQIGRNSTADEIRAMLTGGNLRERMTAFYNAAFFNSPPGGPPLRGFKQIVSQILLGQHVELARKHFLAENELQGKATFFGGKKRSAARAGASLFDRINGTDTASKFADDPFALGNLTLAQGWTEAIELGRSQDRRAVRPPADQDARKQTAADHAGEHRPLSARETAYTTPHTVAGRLPWLSGKAYYEMGDNKWRQDIRDALHMPVAAGVSGTTTRMLSALAWLGSGASPLDFRLALLGWMLPVGDHSLYEILRGAQLAGVQGPGENLGNVIDMYMNVAPLTKSELRANAGHDRQFPHELVYMQRMTPQAQAGGFTAMSDLNSAEGTANHAADDALAPKPDFSVAHATAIHGYTSGIHVLMNAAIEAPTKLIAEAIIKKKLKADAVWHCRSAHLASRNVPLTAAQIAEQLKLQANPVEPIDVLDKQGRRDAWDLYCDDPNRTSDDVNRYISGTVDPAIEAIIAGGLYSELMSHVNMNVEALSALPPANGVVYRGDWTAVGPTSLYKTGKEITYKTLTSSSRDEDVARGFATKSFFSQKVIVTLTLKPGGGGRDIAAFSAAPDEEEVLLMPGTKIRVTAVNQENRPNPDGVTQDQWKNVTAIEI